MSHVRIEGDTVTVTDESGGERVLGIGTPEAFRILSKIWLRSGWDTKHVYSFTWLGRPIIQLPEDIVRVQEVIYRVHPDVVIETGVAHGGSLVFYASLLKAMGGGRVVGVDVEIRPHNRRALEAHELFGQMTLVEGSSIDPKTVERVRMLVQPGEKVMVILDSNHTKDHVLGELRAYGDLVTVDSYVVACDAIMRDLVGAPRTKPDWGWNNPGSAVEEFLKERKDFVSERVPFAFNEGVIQEPVTYWVGGYLRRVSA